MVGVNKLECLFFEFFQASLFVRKAQATFSLGDFKVLHIGKLWPYSQTRLAL